MLTQFSKLNNPIIRTTPNNAYQFVNPMYKLCIRAMLEKDPISGKINQITIDKIQENLSN